MHTRQNQKFRCWAKTCGGCGEGPSAEHLISKCLFPEGMISVSGFDWCKNESKIIGVNSLQRKILCKKHNSDLSETDMEAKKVSNIFERTAPLNNEKLMGDSSVDGHKLERWLLKTAINLSFGGQHHIGVGMLGSVPGLPPPYLIDVAFGKLPFSHLMGAHFLSTDQETFHKSGEIMVLPLIKDDHIGGFYFELRSLSIFLNLFAGHAPSTLARVAAQLELQQTLLDAKLIYRSAGISTNINGAPVSTVKFNWQTVL